MSKDREIAEGAENDPWPVSFGVKSFYRASDNEQYFLTSMSGQPLPVSRVIAHFNPDKIKKMLDVIDACEAAAGEMSRLLNSESDRHNTASAELRYEVNKVLSGIRKALAAYKESRDG